MVLHLVAKDHFFLSMISCLLANFLVTFECWWYIYSNYTMMDSATHTSGSGGAAFLKWQPRRFAASVSKVSGNNVEAGPTYLRLCVGRNWRSTALALPNYLQQMCMCLLKGSDTDSIRMVWIHRLCLWRSCGEFFAASAWLLSHWVSNFKRAAQPSLCHR